MAKQTLELLPQSFAIHCFSPKATIPPAVLQEPLFFIGRTRDELSIVVPEQLQLASEECEPGWAALEVLGPLGFSMTGILASIATVLAKAKVSIFAISTFDTDYIMVKRDNVKAAVHALRQEGYTVLANV